MNKHFLKVVATMGIISILSGLFGCSKNGTESKDKIIFSKYSQSERQAYIADYLKNHYNQSYSVSEVKKKQITALHNEEYYFATAKGSDEVLSIWVADNGDIIDSFFITELEDEIKNEFSNEIDDCFSDYQMKIYTELQDIPSKSWSKSDDIHQMLSTEPIYTFIYLIINESTDVNTEKVQELLKKMSYTNGMLYIKKVSNPQLADINEYSFSDYDYKEEFIRGD